MTDPAVPPADARPDAALPPRDAPARRPSVRFLFRHPAHFIAHGAGSGLAPKAPGTVGTLWGWASYLLLDPWLSDAAWGGVIVAALLIGWWACTLTARHLGTADPGSVVWDEIVAFWLVLWLVMPTGLVGQAVAFAIFRFFDAAKPGPVRWADGLFKHRAGGAQRSIGWSQGFGILFDDLVAALCTLVVIALWRSG